MTPAASELLDRVRAAGADLVVEDGRLRVRGPEPLPDELVSALKARKAELLAVIAAAGGDPYRQRIATARCWDDLYAILADAEVAYAAGDLNGPEVEELATACAREARSLPEHAEESRA